MKKSFIGTIISTKMDQTAVVGFERWKISRLLKKRYKTKVKFLAHNQDNKYQVGQLVKITETRPLSRRKHFIIEGTANKEDR